MASLRDRLLGAWRLAEFTVTAEDGTVTYPMGEDVEGLIIYTPDGYMSAQLMEPGRPAYASGEFTHGTEEEEAAAAAGYLAYSGPFYVNEETATLKHHMSVSLFPKLAQPDPGTLRRAGGRHPHHHSGADPRRRQRARAATDLEARHAQPRSRRDRVQPPRRGRATRPWPTLPQDSRRHFRSD